MAISTQRFSNKGQVSLFIIIGIVILVSIFTIQFGRLPRSPSIPASGPESEVSTVKQFLAACFEDSVLSSMRFIEETGAFNPEMETIPFQDKDVAVLVINGTSTIPSLQDLEMQLAQLVLSGYEECEPDGEGILPFIENFQSATSRVDITPKNIQFLLDVPTRLSTAGREVVGLGSNGMVVASPLYLLHQTALALSNELVQEPGTLPLNALADSAFPIYINTLSDHQAIVRIVEPPSEDLTPRLKTLIEDRISDSSFPDSDTPAHSYSFGVQW